MKNTAFLLSLFLTGIPAFSQSETKTQLDYQPLKWEIMVDALPLLNSNMITETMDAGITFKYKFDKTKLRLSLQSYQENSNPNSTYYNQNIHSTIKVGFERETSPRLVSFYYGADLLFGTHKFYSSYNEVRQDLFTRFTLSNSSYSGSANYSKSNFIVGLAPFIGFNLNVTKNVAFSLNLASDFYYTLDGSIDGIMDFGGFFNSQLGLNVRF